MNPHVSASANMAGAWLLTTTALFLAGCAAVCLVRREPDSTASRTMHLLFNQRRAVMGVSSGLMATGLIALAVQICLDAIHEPWRWPPAALFALAGVLVPVATSGSDDAGGAVDREAGSVSELAAYATFGLLIMGMYILSFRWLGEGNGLPYGHIAVLLSSLAMVALVLLAVTRSTLRQHAHALLLLTVAAWIVLASARLLGEPGGTLPGSI